MNAETGLTHDGVIDIVGRIEDWKIAKIIAVGATLSDLREAQAGVVEKGDLEVKTERRMSRQGARLFEIFITDEAE